MGGRASKQKGYRGEKEFAEKVGGKRIPCSGNARDFPDDVVLKTGERVEVKRRKTGLKNVYKWLNESEADLLAFREDHNDWVIIMPLKKFLQYKEGGLER